VPQFLNSYHFVPLKARDRSRDLTLEQFQRGELGAARHDRYVEQTHSGRIVCRLTAKSPLVVGAEQTPGDGEQPGRVEPYRLGGEIAIPASTLRGMCSAVAEAASNSAPRILKNRSLSYRQRMRDSLSAIGMVVMDARADKRWLIPLTLPTIAARQRDRWEVRAEYRSLYDHAALRVYVGCLDAEDSRNKITSSDFAWRSFVLNDANQGLVWGMRLGIKRTIEADGSIKDDENMHVKWGDENNPDARDFLVGQEILNIELAGWARKWSEIPTAERANYVAGVFRVLGVWGRDVPDTKKHELFLPIPNVLQRLVDPENSTLRLPRMEDVERKVEISDEAWNRFHDLAGERWEAVKDRTDDPILPYEPRDTRPNRGRDKLQLRSGDLVYFRVERNAGRVAAEIALSSNWRSRVEKTTDGTKAAARVHDFFRRADEELVPFQPGRRRVTPAELVFGFVEDRPEKKPEMELPAIAGRVRFSAGRLENAPTNPDTVLEANECTLKILGSPKPPSPALYFRKRIIPNHQYIAKGELSLSDHLPQGRKFYLHATESQISEQFWRTNIERDDGVYKANLKQKLRVRPIRQTTTFLFHIDYTNLTNYELGMILYALEPSTDFQHKLGLGKPYGLGSVKVEVAAVCEVDRQRRYSAEGFGQSRYHRAWRKAGESLAGYKCEMSAPLTEGFTEGSIRDVFVRAMNPVIRRAIEVIGAPRQANDPRVHYPLCGDQGQRANEHETFQWFVWNEDSGRNALEPLDARAAKDVVLKPLEAPASSPAGRGGRR